MTPIAKSGLLFPRVFGTIFLKPECIEAHVKDFFAWDDMNILILNNFFL